MHAVYCKFTLYFDYKSRLILKFGSNFSGKFPRRLGTETTRLDLEWPGRLNGGDSQFSPYSVLVIFTVAVILLTYMCQSANVGHKEPCAV